VKKTAPANTLTPPQRTRWDLRSILLLLLAWFALQAGGLFTPGLLDDVDSVYIQIAREMLQRHDFVTPTIDGIRFFDKPPLMYWMAAGSMHVFGIHDWAARLPLALGVLALLLAVYALGIRLFSTVSPLDHPDRGGLYAALAMATSIGPYLYTRFYIPDILIALWMTLSIHLFLIALDRLREGGSALLPALGFAVVMALDVLTKGLIGIIFPFGFVLLYLLFTRQLRLLLKLQIPAATGLFLLLAAPWHILAALRNPAISMPAGVGLPARAGWAWFYLYNEHIARFLGRRIPHDYGQVPILLFWLLLVLWLVPWAAFLPSAVLDAVRDLRQPKEAPLRFDSDIAAGYDTVTALQASARSREAALSLLLWAGIILGFFTLSSRQEYYHLPALPALALLVGGMLAAADRRHAGTNAAQSFNSVSRPQRQALQASQYFLVPLGSLLFAVCGYLALNAHTPPAGVDLNALLSSNPALYNLSLGHVFDLTSDAMGCFRGPLWIVALCMLALGPGSHLLRSKRRTFAANLVVAASMTGVLLAAHEGLVRFYPILGSKSLALAIDAARRPGDIVVIDGELTSGSTLLFYTDQPILLVNGRVNGPWFGGFWPDAPHIFEDEAGLHQLWRGPHRIFLLTYTPGQRKHDLSSDGKVIDFASSGGKTILTNR
jgi:4-amino-4-deoxy-L-arabinose transferase-like glycosyltransferase